MAPGTRDQCFIVEDLEPVSIETWRSGRLGAKLAAAHARLRECRACPRECGVDRWSGDGGTCQTGRWARVASAFAHFGEESCLRGSRGSGTIFFASCNLRCVFCQNEDISHASDAGRMVDARELAGLMLALQEEGCHNVNLVTPSHVVPQVVEALAVAIPAGLRVPVVYNTSAYDALDSLALLDGLVDIYMPDFKFWEAATARELARAEDYPERARAAIREMHRQVGELRFGADGVARRGVLVRHLVMPGQGGQSAAIFRWLAREVSPDTFVNVMGQYRPSGRVGMGTAAGARRHQSIHRRPGAREMAAAGAAARDAGLHRFDERPWELL